MAEKPLNIVKNRIDTTVYSVQIEEKESLRILAIQAIKGIGNYSIDAPFVRIHSYISSRDSSTGPQKYARIEITVDHSMQDKANDK